ncbi:DUF4215 domain-containing protein [Sorangium sp. So ce406]|uniref:DUF4215 domain-containing protein n=1 Tax=Sorangium sp. So ce406 TaxID=3133311 RepID=UPI003F5C0919
MAGLFVLALSTTAGCGDDDGEGGSGGSGGAGGIDVTGSGTGGSDATSTGSSGGAGPTGTGSATGSGGAEPTGTGSATGSGGAEPTGTGSATGSGGAEPTGGTTGSGGAEPTGTGSATGSGGAEPTGGTGGATGSGGAEPTGTGSATGTGGAEPTGATGTGGAEPTGATGTGGAEPTGATGSGGAEPTGTGVTGSGGAEPTGTGGVTGSGGAEPTGTGGVTGSGGAEPTGTGGATGSGGAEPTGAGGAEPTGGTGGGPSTIYGAACADHEACAGEYCITETEWGWPSGSCASPCDPAVGACSEGGVCVDFGEGVGLCVLRCSGPDACRDGYTCSEIVDGITACTPACTDHAQCTEVGMCDPFDSTCKPGEAACADGVDDEGDGLTDCADHDCSATCGPIADAACADAAAVTTTTTIEGDTSTGTSVFQASCTGGGPEQLHLFRPPAGQSGTLLVVLQSESDHGLYARTVCTNSFAEIDCNDEYAATDTRLEEEELELVVHRDEAVPIFVDAYSPDDAGPYTLDFVFSPAICGDGIISQPEECDDRNTTSGDGCSAECTLELDDACADALPAVLGDNQGDTSTGTRLFNGTCFTRGMPEKIHTYMPPSDGTLTLALSSATDLGLYVRTSCADADSQIRCEDSAAAGRVERLELDVDGGAPLFIFVDTYSVADAGRYTLNLAFTPAR